MDPSLWSDSEIRMEGYNLGCGDYPDWKKGAIFGLAGGIISTICICVPLLMATAKTKEQGGSPLLFSAGVFVFCFFVFGAYGAFRPPK